MSLVILGTSVIGSALWSHQIAQCSGLSCYLFPFITIFASQTLSLAVYNVVLYPFYLSPLRHLPHPKQPSLRHRFLKEPGHRLLRAWINEIPNNGLIRYYGLFNRERVFVTRPSGCKEVLQLQGYNYSKFPWALEIMGQVIPLSVVVAPQEKHKADRKLLQPAFKFKYVQNLYPTFWDEGSKFLRNIERRMRDTDTDVIDIGKGLHDLALDIITLTAFGGSLDAVAKPDSELAQHFRNIFAAKISHVNYRYLAFLLPTWIYRRLPMKARREIDTAVQNVRAFILPLVTERRKMNYSSGDAKTISQGDLIATVLQSGDQFSDDYLIDQSLGFMIAGHETTAVATSLVLYLLSENPEVQSRLRQEVRAMLPSPSLGSPIDATLIESLPYLTAVCNEVLRLDTPIPDTRRLTVAPNTVVESVPIPPGTVVVVAGGVIHRSREIWGSDAAEFNPDRWFHDKETRQTIDPLGGSSDPYAFMTFTYGPRACMGERFARAEMATLVAQLVGSFEWKFKGIGPKGDKPMRMVYGLTASPVGGGVTMYAKKLAGW